MDRQTLRDRTHRYNGAGLDGVSDRARSGRPACLSKAERATVAAWVDAGTDLSRDGVARFRRANLRYRIAAVFAVDQHERSIGELLAELGYRRVTSIAWCRAPPGPEPGRVAVRLPRQAG